MKKFTLITLSLFASVIGAFPASGWNVSSEPARKNVLIEEYTGINCPNCPDGMRVVNELKALHPDRIYSVAIHAGGYAEPGFGAPDYTTALGDALNAQFQPMFFPCAVVQRRASDGEMIISREDWGPLSRIITAETAPVNLWMTSTLDSDSRELKVTVEGYLTEDITDPRLNIFLLQSEIIGPQAGGLLGDEYHHRHMLRDRVTSEDFGEKIEAGKGEYFTRTYTYAVPDAIESINVAPEHLSLLCFVTDGVNDVCQVIESEPELSKPVGFLIAEVTEPLIKIGKNYALDYLEVVLHNYGNVALTNADFDVTLNKEKTAITWTGEIAPFSSAIVRLPLDGKWKESYDNDENSYVIRMMKANGTEVYSPSMRGSFHALFSYPEELKLVIKTDMNASDNLYRIIDENGEVISEFGPYAEGEVQEVTETVSLEKDKIYGLEITDAWGDGIRHPRGQVKIYDKEDKLVAQIKEISDFGMRQFFRTNASSTVDGLETEANVTATEMFDLSGRRVAESEIANGIYVVRTHYDDGTVKIEKRIINH